MFKFAVGFLYSVVFILVINKWIPVLMFPSIVKTQNIIKFRSIKSLSYNKLTYFLFYSAVITELLLSYFSYYYHLQRNILKENYLNLNKY